MDLGGLFLRGRIDLVEVHEPTGRVRVVDYKTGETASEPAKEHLRRFRSAARCPHFPFDEGDDDESWINLQLPLYAEVARRHFGTEDISVAYFSLSRDPATVALAEWDGFNRAHRDSALATAARVVEAWRESRFWPPTAEEARSLAEAGEDVTNWEPGLLRSWNEGVGE